MPSHEQMVDTLHEIRAKAKSLFGRLRHNSTPKEIKAVFDKLSEQYRALYEVGAKIEQVPMVAEKRVALVLHLQKTLTALETILRNQFELILVVDRSRQVPAATIETMRETIRTLPKLPDPQPQEPEPAPGS